MTGKLNLILSGILMSASQAIAAGQTPFPSEVGETGCIIEQITNSKNPEYQVQGVSWDGKWFTYGEEIGEGAHGIPDKKVYLLDLASGEKKVLPGAMKNSGGFSPDGRFIVGAFRRESERTDIYEFNLETEELKPIAQHDHWDWLPSYSPDGSTIVFNSYRIDGQSQIFLYDRESEALRQMTDFPGYDAHAEFSPDGTKILFHRMMARKEQGGYDFELFVIDIESGEETQLTPSSDFEESYASWAPDGQHVVFSSDRDGKPEKHNLYILGPDGEIVSRLTKGDWKDSYAFWTRDGKHIYFNSDRNGDQNIYRIPMDGLDCHKSL